MGACYHLPIIYSVVSKQKNGDSVDLILRNCKHQDEELEVRIDLKCPNERKIKPSIQVCQAKDVYYLYQGRILTNGAVGDSINLASTKEDARIDWASEPKDLDMLQLIFNYMEI